MTLPIMNGCAGPNAALYQDGVHDFPPLVDPHAPAQTSPDFVAQVSGLSDRGSDGETDFVASDRVRVPVTDGSGPFGGSAYRIGVEDEMNVIVLDQPNYTRAVKVLPDGTISSAGTGTIYVLGKTVTEAASEIEERLRTTLRYPQVDLVVTKYGDHVIYVMGEVNIPADHPYRKGMSSLQAVAAAGGFLDSAKRTNVCVFRRTGPDVAEFIQLDLKGPLAGRDFENDIMLRPYDIVYVPRSVIGNVNNFINQYFRQNLSALNFYLTGWDAYSVTKDRVTIQRNN